MDPQLPIKIILVAAVILVAALIVWPGRGARRVALRRLGTILLVFAAIAAIVFPEITGTIANFLGVGRGADLLLYGTVVAFLGFAFTTRIEKRRVDAQLTQIARAQAIASARRPWETDRAA
ncbi:MAG TPA: DUF2304 domain-containing protein [Microbacteriaceae bacterium]|nr:DUF2304 domain-containing protein [Microbacteriaceae bacterium]